MYFDSVKKGSRVQKGSWAPWRWPMPAVKFFGLTCTGTEVPRDRKGTWVPCLSGTPGTERQNFFCLVLMAALNGMKEQKAGHPGTDRNAACLKAPSHRGLASERPTGNWLFLYGLQTHTCSSSFHLSEPGGAERGRSRETSHPGAAKTWCP